MEQNREEIVEKAQSIHCGGIWASHGNNSITNCYHIGNLQIKQAGTMVFQTIGGIVGEVTNCYHYGNIEYQVDSKKIGEIVGYDKIDKTILGGYLVHDNLEAIGQLELGRDQTIGYHAIEEMPTIQSVIGEGFKQDENDKNQGKPILKGKFKIKNVKSRNNNFSAFLGSNFFPKH